MFSEFLEIYVKRKIIQEREERDGKINWYWAKQVNTFRRSCWNEVWGLNDEACCEWPVGHNSRTVCIYMCTHLVEEATRKKKRGPELHLAIASAKRAPRTAATLPHHFSHSLSLFLFFSWRLCILFFFFIFQVTFSRAGSSTRHVHVYIYIYICI